METKKENQKVAKRETHKKTDEAAFEPAPEKKEKKCCSGKNFPLGFLAGFFIMGLLAVGMVYAKISPLIKKEAIKNPVTIEQAKIKAETFINENLMQPGTKITIKEAEEK
ncbi:hypothetical protein KJ854_03095, partial [Patescibacteria group bacterium]|nr:hypothetical protein [Patescibacteria group bacterium]